MDIMKGHTRRLENQEEQAWFSNESISTGRMLTQHTVGDVKLLEANTTRHEVFSGTREPNSKITCRVHARLSGGRHCDYSIVVSDG